jgi:hypothetical protein
MLKKLIILIVLTISYSASAQVGIGNTTPNGALDITSTNNGLLIPRIALVATNIATVVTPTVSELVYNTATSGIGALQVTPGYYYWNGTIWIRLATSGTRDWSVDGNSGTNPSINFAGTTDLQDFAFRTNNIERARIKSTGELGLGTTAPRGALDINSTTQGMVPPRVPLTRTNLAAPVINPAGGGLVSGTLVWNTGTSLAAIPVADRVAPGMYYWNGTRWISLAGSPGGLDWSIIGNGGIDGGTTGTAGVPATIGTHFLGTYDNTNMDIRTNGNTVARFSSLGEFFIGAIETVLPGDLMNGVGNAPFPWAVNGYTDFNGAGTYGLVTSGNTIFAGVQGEYQGTNSRGPGVRGLTSTTGVGSNYTNDVTSGVHGQLGNANRYSFGVKGDTGTNLQIRTGGVLGTDLIAAGALGYFASNGTSYALYAMGGTNFGAGGGRMSSAPLDTSIGLGVSGGFMGGWIKGSEYGLINNGNRFASYNLGKTITNESFIVLDKKLDGSKTVSYATTSMSIDIQEKGMGQLVNGKVFIPFNKEYSQIVDDSKPIIVTVTPFGESKGVHLVSVDKNGFFIKENSSGNSNVKFNWIAIGEKMNKNTIVSSELLDKDFDKNIDKIMLDENSKDESKAIWYENGEIKFGDKAPINPLKSEAIENTPNSERPR